MQVRTRNVLTASINRSNYRPFYWSLYGATRLKDVNEIFVLQVGDIIKCLVTHTACLIFGFLLAPFARRSHTGVNNDSGLAHALAHCGMLAVEQFDPQHPGQHKDHDQDEKGQVYSQTASVVRLLRWLEELGPDDVSCAGADEQYAGSDLALGVSASVLA